MAEEAAEDLGARAQRLLDVVLNDEISQELHGAISFFAVARGVRSRRAPRSGSARHSSPRLMCPDAPPPPAQAMATQVAYFDPMEGRWRLLTMYESRSRDDQAVRPCHALRAPAPCSLQLTRL